MTFGRQRSMRPVLVVIALVAACFVVLVLASFTYGPLKGAYHRTFHTPAIISESFIRELTPDQATELRREFLRQWQAGGTFGLRRVVRTVEGSPLPRVLVTQQGSLTLVTDYTRDPYSIRRFVVEHPVSVELASPADTNPLQAWFPPRSETLLKCTFASRGEAWF